MIEIYHWEDDDEAEDFIQELEERGLKYNAVILDPEAGEGQTAITYQGKTHWSFAAARSALGLS